MRKRQRKVAMRGYVQKNADCQPRVTPGGYRYQADSRPNGAMPKAAALNAAPALPQQPPDGHQMRQQHQRHHNRLAATANGKCRMATLGCSKPNFCSGEGDRQQRIHHDVEQQKPAPARFQSSRPAAAQSAAVRNASQYHYDGSREARP